MKDIEENSFLFENDQVRGRYQSHINKWNEKLDGYGHVFDLRILEGFDLIQTGHAILKIKNETGEKKVKAEIKFHNDKKKYAGVRKTPNIYLVIPEAENYAENITRETQVQILNVTFSEDVQFVNQIRET